MTNSILNSTKKILGLEESYKDFDLDIQTHINAVFSDLAQLGVGPVAGHMITGEADQWSAFPVSPVVLNSVKTYMYLRVRLLFDPPTTGFLKDSLEEQIRKMEFRLNVAADVPPPVPIVVIEEVVP